MLVSEMLALTKCKLHLQCRKVHFEFQDPNAGAYAAADKAGLRVVGGSCPTVGIVGGFTQGSGHSDLPSIHGMGADQTLEWEVVTANGTHLIATPEQNSDLYWALSGGGGGTYGVVLSLTSKAFKDGIVVGASILIANPNITTETFYGTLEAWHAILPASTDAGAATTYFNLRGNILTINPTFPGTSKAEVQSLLRPYLNNLTSLGVTPTSIEITEFPSFFQHYFHYDGP